MSNSKFYFQPKLVESRVKVNVRNRLDPTCACVAMALARLSQRVPEIPRMGSAA